jgi:alpha-D-ribose 1-methylphosphonate 5-triphosphate synthase subunit PhnH
MLTHLPGFQDSVHDAQRTFRSLLDALARPGIPQATALVTPPTGLLVGCGAACLTLLDLETVVWLQRGFSEEVRSWLLFHTGCRFTSNPWEADFALIADVATAPPLEAFNSGTPEYPEASTALLMQLPALQGGQPVTLQGPGILSAITLDLPLPEDFWRQWREMTAGYPLGVDGWCFAADQVVGLPRTAQVMMEVGENVL